MRRILIGTILWSFIATAALAAEPAAGPPSSADLEFFEKQIRPLFAEHCYQCHGEKKQESSLSLNSAAGIRRGGDRGSAILSGEPDASILIQAVRYTDDELKMPPRGRLKDEQIATLVEWVRRGAALPVDNSVESSAPGPISEFNLAERRQHWSYQPVQPGELPTAATSAWCQSPIDRYILAGLDNVGLSPAEPAAKRALIRRVTFDLTGLPPRPDDVADFFADERPDAYERLVDRLLASPHYGERWARHWLDVVRYSETLGFEFDYDLHNAWRYRDYVTRALNDDLPYDQFVIEHLAGDLVDPPRRHPLDSTNESILATGFWWMYEGKQTPVDIRQYQADCIDNQLDVLGKAFLGQTIACARCHDHKFDAISTRDYYALAGYLKSSRFQQAFIDSQERRAPALEAMAAEQERVERELGVLAADALLKEASEISRYMLAAAKVERKPASDDRQAKGGERRPRNVQRELSEPPPISPEVEKLAAEAQLDPARLQRWVRALADESLGELDHPLYVWNAATNAEPPASSELAASLKRHSAEANRLAAKAVTFSDFREDPRTLDNWLVTGDEWVADFVIPGLLVIGNSPERPVARLTTGWVDSGALSLRVQGEMRSASFTIDKNYVHLRLAGRDARVNLVIDGYTLIMNPMYGKLTVNPESDRLVWRTIPVDRWVGHRAYFEFSDSTIPPHGLNPPPSAARMPVAADGYIAMSQIVMSDDPQPPSGASGIATSVLERAKGVERERVAAEYQEAALEAISPWRAAERTALSEDGIGYVNWLLENGLLDAVPDASDSQKANSLATIIQRFKSLEAAIPAPTRAPAFADGTGEDERVFLRGNHRTLGEVAMRGLPEVLCSAAQPSPPTEGSGRLGMAQHLASPDNPLFSRVIVNRLWHNHFGAGLVRTPDDFGRMGQPPTHPQLLDYLASELIRGQWALKRMQRWMVTSSVYRQASGVRSQESGDSVDPENKLLSRMPIRRLEAEAIRDAMLAVSGRLDTTLHGPSVLPHITPYMEGRGKPQTGPLDGAGRRSLYINARRNFLTPLLLAFDYPVTFTPIGRRGTSAIPGQALALMNDPFVVAEASRWAERTLAESSSGAEQRIISLYETAYSRSPTADELADAIDFLQAQSLKHGSGSNDPRVWADLCHVLINVKEFIFSE